MAGVGVASVLALVACGSRTCTSAIRCLLPLLRGRGCCDPFCCVQFVVIFEHSRCKETAESSPLATHPLVSAWLGTTSH